MAAFALPRLSTNRIVSEHSTCAGILGLAYGKFSYTKETHDAKVGALELSFKEKQTVNIPAWAGVAAIAAGAVLLLARPKG